MNPAADILKKILQRKAEEIEARARQMSLAALSEQIDACTPTRGFLNQLKHTIAENQPAVIAEIKKASPSKGIIRPDFNPAKIAQSYEQGGATCLSVLTDKDFFQGSEEDLKQARAACKLPVLRKDFIIDAYQVYESRLIGADCILLIVAALGDAMLVDLFGLAQHLDMDVLIEVHDAAELERALTLNAPLIGINNRNLRSFNTDLQTTISLKEKVPDNVLLVTESGIHNKADINLMRNHAVHAFLVGETLMRADNPGDKLTELFRAN